MGIEVLPPDVNSSDHGFVVSGNSIRFGLDAVKNVGHAAVETIIAARESGGEFESIWDFCERVDSRAVNKRAIECLVKCGALDSTGDTRRGMLEVLAAGAVGGPEGPGGLAPRPGLDLRPRRRRAPRRQPAGGLGAAAPPVGLRARSSTSASCCGSRRRRSARSSPRIRSSEVRDALRARVERPARRRSPSEPDGAWVTVGGIVAEAKKVRTRSGGYVMFATLDDLEGQVELFVRDAAARGRRGDRGRPRGHGPGPGRPQGAGGKTQRRRPRGRGVRARARTRSPRRARRRRRPTRAA